MALLTMVCLILGGLARVWFLGTLPTGVETLAREDLARCEGAHHAILKRSSRLIREAADDFANHHLHPPMIPIRCVIVLAALSAGTAAHGAGKLQLQVSEGRIALDAQASTVKEVLDLLAARRVVKVSMDEASAFRARLTTVNARFGRRDLATALGVILADVPHELVKNPDGSVAEVLLVSPLMKRVARPGKATSLRAKVEPVVPSEAAVRAGKRIAEGEPSGPPAAGPPAAVQSSARPRPVRSPKFLIAPPVTLEVPENPHTISGIEVPGLATAEDKAATTAMRSELEAARSRGRVPDGSALDGHKGGP